MNRTCSAPSRMWKKPSFVKRQAAWNQLRIEQHRSRVAVQLEDAVDAARRQEADDRLGLDAEADKSRVEREPALVRGDRIFEQDVEHPLVLDQLGVGRQLRPENLRERDVVGLKRLVRWQRRADRDHARIGQRPAVFLDLQVVAQPERRGIVEKRIGTRDVEHAGRSGHRPVDVVQRFERRAQQQPQPLPFRLEKHLNRDVVGNLVRARGGRQPDRPAPRSPQAAAACSEKES